MKKVKTETLVSLSRMYFETGEVLVKTGPPQKLNNFESLKNPDVSPIRRISARNDPIEYANISILASGSINEYSLFLIEFTICIIS